VGRIKVVYFIINNGVGHRKHNFKLTTRRQGKQIAAKSQPGVCAILHSSCFHHIFTLLFALPFLLHLLLSENIFLAVLVGVGGRCSMGVAGQRSRREIWQCLKNYTNIFREILLYFLKHLFGFIEICLYAKSSIIYL